MYVNASVPPTGKVCLWLGVSGKQSGISHGMTLINLFYIWQANVMLEYDIDEAEKMLNSNLESANKTLETVENDLGFLKDQYVTTEVSILFKKTKIGAVSLKTSNSVCVISCSRRSYISVCF